MRLFAIIQMNTDFSQLIGIYDSREKAEQEILRKYPKAKKNNSGDYDLKYDNPFIENDYFGIYEEELNAKYE